MLYSFKGNYPNLLPSTIWSEETKQWINTSELINTELHDYGYVPVVDPPTQIDSGYELFWQNNEWKVIFMFNKEPEPELPQL